MLHAAVIWRFYQRLNRAEQGAARTLIDVFESYRLAIQEPLFDITHVAFVPRLPGNGCLNSQLCLPRLPLMSSENRRHGKLARKPAGKDTLLA